MNVLYTDYLLPVIQTPQEKPGSLFSAANPP